MGLAAALACGAGMCGENLLKNGDFECGSAKGWGNWTAQAKAKVVKEGAHGGACCLEYAVESDKGGFIVNFAPLPSNGTYTVSGWLKGDAGVVEIRLFYRTADGKYLGEAPAFTASKLADWTHFAKAFSLPVKCEAVQVGLHVARGRAWLDDVCVEAGNQVGEAPNEIPNSAFAYILHENGMPELWNTGGGYSFDTFKPGVHEGEYYRMAPEVAPPVKGARVLFQSGIGFSTWKTGPLAGDTDYVFSVWAKSEAPDAKLQLKFAGKAETFALSNVWRRCVLKAHLKNGLANGYPYFGFFRNPVYLSAPMLHAGSVALPWKPSPLDANFADLKGGTQAATKASRREGSAKVADSHPRVATEFDYYTTEAVARVLVEDARGEVTVTLADARGKAVRTASVRNGQARFALADLAEGVYEVEAKAANGAAKARFRKASAAKHYTRINRFKRQIEMDGKPFFPMVHSWWSKSGELPTAWQIAELKSHNFNTIMPMPEMYSAYNKLMTPAFRVATMKAFADAGFKFIVWAAGSAIKQSGIAGLVEQRKVYLDELAAFKKDIVGWYYVDEIGPSWEKTYNIRLEDFSKGYHAMKDYDPARLHFINWNWTGIAENTPWYAEKDATDLYSLDCYPYSNNLYGYGALATFERGAQLLCGRVCEQRLPGIMWLQTYNYQEGTREPMPVEYRNNVCIGLINRVSGFMSFIGRPENKDLWDEMGNSYALALKWLEMTARPGAEEVRRGREGSVSYALWKDGHGGHALVAANTRYAPETLTLTSDAPLGGTIERIGGEGDLSADGKTLKVELPVAGSAIWFVR